MIGILASRELVESVLEVDLLTGQCRVEVRGRKGRPQVRTLHLRELTATAGTSEILCRCARVRTGPPPAPRRD
jgi:hypothetical protein